MIRVAAGGARAGERPLFEYARATPPDPTRRRILELLGRGPATISELAEPFDLTFNGVKKHVTVLEDADIVVTQKVGRARECRVGPAQLQEATRWIEQYTAALDVVLL